jgi:hypothetical protein
VTGSRSIRFSITLLALLAVTLTGPEWTKSAAVDCLMHVKGRVRTGLPLDGSFGSCGGIGLRWPGDGGDEYLGGGGLFVRCLNAAGGPIESGAFETITFETKGFFDGCERGKRYPHPLRDDDGDGVVDEDPPDGVDNDGDGLVDEDFAAIGDEMFVTVAADRETGLVRKQSSYTWTFGHVRDFIGFTTTIRYPKTATGLLRNLEATLYMDFDVGDERDAERGEDDRFFVIEREWEGGVLRLPAVRDGDGGRFAALLLLEAVRASGEAIGARALFVAAPGAPPFYLDPAAKDGEIRESDLPPAVRVLPRDAVGETGGESTVPAGDGGAIDGDGAMACVLEPLPEFWPGDELSLHWAVIFGKSETKLVKNALRALETFDGLPDGEGALHRWIVPARRAARITLEAFPAYVWEQGIRRPAATIMLPSSLEGEEIEWLRGSNAAEVQHQQVDGRVLVTVEAPVDAGTVVVEGQLTDGTIFTTSLSGETLYGAQEEGQRPDTLPDDSVQLYPNPFLTTLNINVRIFDSALTEESAATGSVRIYDVRGRLVRTILEQGPPHPGEYLHTWDGLDEYGKEAAPGVYYVKLQIGDRSVTKRVILLR